jgi:Uncharacterized protein conserved in bacteria (DUF2312)
MLPRSVARWFGAGSLWHAYRVEPLSTERGTEAHLDSVKLTMPMGQLIKIRKMGKGEHDEQESLLDLYKRAIGMLPEAGPSAQAAQ